LEGVVAGGAPGEEFVRGAGIADLAVVKQLDDEGGKVLESSQMLLADGWRDLPSLGLYGQGRFLLRLFAAQG
jgi:hypothetical protein